MMHGQITAEENQPSIITIKGRLDWFFMVWIFFAAILPLSLQLVAIIASIVLTGELAVLYVLQRKHFNMMCQILAGQTESA